MIFEVTSDLDHSMRMHIYEGKIIIHRGKKKKKRSFKKITIKSKGQNLQKFMLTITPKIIPERNYCCSHNEHDSSNMSLQDIQRHESFAPQKEWCFFLRFVWPLPFILFPLCSQTLTAFFCLPVLYTWDNSKRRFCDELSLCQHLTRIKPWLSAFHITKSYKLRWNISFWDDTSMDTEPNQL